MLRRYNLAFAGFPAVPRSLEMKIADVRARSFAMPLNDPSYPPGPYHFYDREYLVVEYLTDPTALRAVVPEPLEISDPIVRFEFIRLPDTTGFGDFTECGQMIPVRFRGESGIFVHSMYLDDEAPIAGGREIWGVPQKLARPKLCHESEVLVGTLHFGSVLCAMGSMGYKGRGRSRLRRRGGVSKRGICNGDHRRGEGDCRQCWLCRWRRQWRRGDRQ
jgi:acetoacetate decarboxylase